ncbi:MAG: ABC transporter ATP-binding protein [Thermomicrobiales bacterium]
MTQHLSSAIEMHGITKRFAGVVANDDVEFSARFGEVHALVGENGAGKSTLMSILAGMYRPDEGEVRISGEPVEFRSPRDAIAHGIGMVYQHFMLVEPFTVAENCLLGKDGQRSWLDTSEVERRLAALSAQYGLGVDPRSRIWQLSVGEQQRVEILRLLFRGAKILVFDEPTAVLTPQESDALIRTLRGMAADGFCVVFISHKLGEVMAVADRLTVLRRGRVVATMAASETDRHTLARMMVGRDLASFVEHPDVEPVEGKPNHFMEGKPNHFMEAVPAGEVVLDIRGLSALGDKGLPALNEIDLHVRSGEILGVAGVAGNGQRELAEVVTGLRPCTGGHVWIVGRETTRCSAGEIASFGVAHVPEDRLATGLVGSMELSGNAILRDYTSPPIARGSFLVGRAIAAFTDKLVSDYDITAAGRGAKIWTLSGGNQQKLLIGRELAGDPTVIVAVHPTRGVDVGATETIHSLLREQRTRGAAILLISEDLDELLALSDRIAVLYDGRITGELPAQGADPERIGLLMAGLTSEADTDTAVPSHG